jgi:hypothetical protein
MNAGDARIARLYTSPPGGITEDTTPNAGPPRTDVFDLILQLEAGNQVGNSGGVYDLTITAINDDTGGAVAGLAPAGPFVNQQFNPPPPPVPPATEPGTGWEAASNFPGTNDFVLTGAGIPAQAGPPAIPATPRMLGIRRFRITVPAGPLTGQFHYNVRLVNQNRQIVDFAQSNPFVLV